MFALARKYIAGPWRPRYPSDALSSCPILYIRRHSSSHTLCAQRDGTHDAKPDSHSEPQDPVLPAHFGAPAATPRQGMTFFRLACLACMQDAGLLRLPPAAVKFFMLEPEASPWLIKREHLLHQREFAS